MLPGMMGTQGSVLQPNCTLLEAIKFVGVETNLRVCLDAGDSRSYDGSSQTWTDQSGGGFSFFRGTTGSGEASDPTFNGTAGRQSSGEYFSVDGGDWFTLNQSNPSWLDSFHKASAKFTICEWVYLNNIVSTSSFFGSIGDNQVSGATGAGITFGSSGSTLLALDFLVTNAVPAVVYEKKTSNTATNNSWNFLSVSVDMTIGTVIYRINGNTETYTSQSYTSPASVTSKSTIQLAAGGGGAFPDSTGERWGEVALWDRALSATELSNLFTATRQRYGV
jgi:hypothetical protein